MRHQFTPCWAALQPMLERDRLMETQRERAAVMVEPSAAIDYIMKERLFDTEVWLVWMTMAVVRIVFES